MFIVQLLISFFACILLAHAAAPITISANVRGKRYEITASTVEEVTSAIESAAGLEASEQSVLFRGKVLNTSDILADVGVASGDTLNIVKGRRARPTKSSNAGSAVDGGLEDMKFPEGMDAEKYKEAMANVSPEEMQKASKAMDELLDSEFINEYFADDDKLEAARLEMLKNIDKYDQAMPGFKDQAKEIASDPKKWKDAMETAKNQMLQLKRERDAAKGKQGGSSASNFSGSSASSPPAAPSQSGSTDFAEEDEE